MSSLYGQHNLRVASVSVADRFQYQDNPPTGILDEPDVPGRTRTPTPPRKRSSRGSLFFSGVSIVCCPHLLRLEVETAMTIVKRGGIRKKDQGEPLQPSASLVRSWC